MNSKVTATAKKQKASIRVNRPAWSKVYEGYPKRGAYGELKAEEVFTSIFGPDYDRKNLGNACATRVSLALLNAGVNIDKKEYVIRIGKFKDKVIIVSAVNMVAWLKRKFGEPDVTIKEPQSLSVIQAQIGNRKGIYAMLPKSSKQFEATGHVTLWVGHTVMGGDGHSYYTQARVVYFWELK